MRASPDFAPARSRFGAVLISLVVIGAGCGGDGSTTEPAATEPPAATAATFDAAPLAAAAALLASTAALADITIGVSLPLTGPGSGLGIPMSNGVK